MPRPNFDLMKGLKGSYNLSDRSAIRPIDGLTSKQDDKTTSEPVNTSTPLPVHQQTSAQVDKSSRQPDNRSTYLHVVESSGSQVVPSTHQPVNVSSFKRTDPQFDLSELQQQILMLLAMSPEKKASYRHLATWSGVVVASARDAVTRLAKKGYIGGIRTVRDKLFQGFTFTLNEELYQKAAESEKSTIRPLSAITPTDGLIAYSSSLYNQTTNYLPDPRQVNPSTITPDDGSDSQECFVLTGPEMGYWKEVGLQERQALAWCKEFEVTPEDMRQQLAWMRYDLVAGKEESIKDLINWAYAVLRRNGGVYQRPPGYRTPAEIRRDNLKAQIEAEEKAREEIAELEATAKFNAIFNNPESEEYKKLYSRLSEFAQKLKGAPLRAELQRIWVES